MGARIAACVCQWQSLARRFAVVANRDLAGRGAVLAAVFSLLLALAAWLGPGPLAPSTWQALGLAADGPGLRRVSVRVTEDLERLFAEQGFTLDDDEAGRGVPRLAVSSLPHDMAKIDDPATRKALFLRTLLPLVLEANREVRRARSKVIAALEAQAQGRLGVADALWLDAITQWYGAEPGNAADLLSRIDVVPPSLVLAQAAQESGWGTSRFALRANALFGQRTWGDADFGLVPREAERADFKVRAFPDLMSAVRAYLHNLNSHPAYQALRDRRARARALGAPLHPLELVRGLERYSQEGGDYVASLSALIRSNRLEALDELRLRPLR